jgi:fucose permease
LDLDFAIMPAPNSNSKMPAVKLSSAEPPCIESNGPADPRSLSLQRRWAIAALISIFTFISPMSSSIVAPALDDIGRDLHITGSFTKQLVLSIYLLLHGVVPVLIGPISELYGTSRLARLTMPTKR